MVNKISWYWIFITLGMSLCIGILLNNFIIMYLFEILFICIVPYNIEGKDWRFIKYG
jgi:hypothetical protein